MMKYQLYDLIEKINPLTLQQYLMARNWAKRESKKQDIVIFEYEFKQSYYEIRMPITRYFSDYVSALYRAINIIAQVEERPETQIVNDLLLPPADIIRFRVQNKNTEEGLISLSEGFMLLESAKKALLTTACDIIQPELYHKRLAFKGAKQFIDSCMLGQTERGSFIASLVCPIGNQTNNEKYKQLSLFDPPEVLSSSFTRQITQKLMVSIERVKRIIESQDFSQLETITEDVSPISANFLESLVEMGEYGDNDEIEIMTTWAPTIPSQSNIPIKTTITRDYIQPLESIVERIKERIADEEGIYVGRISQTRADPDPQQRSEGEIIFNFIGNEEKAVNAKVLLDSTNYELALDAHKNGKNVKVKGILRNSGRIKVIENAEFQVLD